MDDAAFFEVAAGSLGLIALLGLATIVSWYLRARPQLQPNALAQEEAEPEGAEDPARCSQSSGVAATTYAAAAEEGAWFVQLLEQEAERQRLLSEIAVFEAKLRRAAAIHQGGLWVADERRRGFLTPIRRRAHDVGELIRATEDPGPGEEEVAGVDVDLAEALFARRAVHRRLRSRAAATQADIKQLNVVYVGLASELKRYRVACSRALSARYDLIPTTESDNPAGSREET